MKRLFCVAYEGSNKPHSLEGAGQSPWFDDKGKAKELRNHLNKDGKPKYRIVKGPDHIRFQE